MLKEEISQDEHVEFILSINDDEDLDQNDYVQGYQKMINAGLVWGLEGSQGREAMRLIEDGYCALGYERSKDYYGNRIPSRFDVVEGTKGSVQFVEDCGNSVLD